ncbi:MAG: CoA-binding protein, partial [Syntrophaceae bacterium]|nr:CoA-binding protein [Syntrophaceae bacterium]
MKNNEEKTNSDGGSDASADNPSPKELLELLKSSRTIAVVGLSDKPDRYSHIVAAYLKSKGYRIIPVNPDKTEIMQEKCYPNLSSIPEPVDIV